MPSAHLAALVEACDPASESSITMALAAHFGIPTAFISGDDVICREVGEWLEGAIDVAAVKEGRARTKNYAAPLRTEVELDSTTTASFVSYLPTVRWDGARRVRFAGADVVEAYRTLCCVAWLTGAVPSS